MWIKNILLVALFITSLLSAKEIEKNGCENGNCCIQKIDTQNWVTFTLDQDIDGGSEKGEIQFPTEPKVSENLGIPLVFAVDNEGMTYSISRMQIVGDYNLKQSFEFLMSSIAASPNKKLLGAGYPYPNPLDSGYFIYYVKHDGQLSMLNLAKGKDFIYFIETNTTNEMYIGLESLEAEGPVFDIFMHDGQKHHAFQRSLKISGEWKITD